MIEGYICIVLCGTCVSVGMHVMAGWLLTLCLSRMSLQPEIMPCWSERSIVTNSLQINRYFIKQLRYKMKYGSFSKMCTNLINDLDHSIKFTYFYLFIRIQEAFNLDKISQLDLNLLNQIPLLISSLFVWDADFFSFIIVVVEATLSAIFLANNSLGNLEMQEWEHGWREGCQCFSSFLLLQAHGHDM